MRGGGEAFDGKFGAGFSRDAASTDFSENGCVISGVTDESNAFVVLRRGADKGHAADVDVFDGISISDIGFGNRLLKGIEVHRNEVDVIPAEIEELLMVFVGGAGEESAVDGGVESLDPSAKDLGRLGVVRDFGDGDVIVVQQFGCPARSEQSPAEISEGFGEFNDSSFVVDGEDGSRHKKIPLDTIDLQNILFSIFQLHFLV